MMKHIKLNNGKLMPALGLGVFLAQDGPQAVAAVKTALEIGYRHLDTAMIYGNEVSVGQAIKQSGLDRDTLFITTKLWTSDIRSGRAREAYQGSIQRLGLSAVDLYLIHWPAQGYQQAWKDLEELYAEGKIRSIGVSNFQIHHLKEIMGQGKVVPAVNQIESNPYFANQEVIDYCLEQGIAVTVWSPLGGQGAPILRDPVLQSIAQAHGKSVAQVIIRWHLQRGLIVIPKSVNPLRLKENFEVDDFELTAEQMQLIKGLNKNMRSGADPDNFPF